MKELEARIRKEGRIWPDGMINLTSFLSHAIDIDFLDRIAQELASRLAAQPNDRHLRRQTTLVYQAQISTIHAFCAAFLRDAILTYTGN